MKLSDIEASETSPKYVNLRIEGTGKFKNSLKWDGRWLYRLVCDHSGNWVWEIKNIPLDQVYSDQWSIDENIESYDFSAKETL